MTAFTRSPSGISNLALFHRVELVLFTEGVVNSYRSFDRIFWPIVFQNWSEFGSVRVKPLGSKRNARNIAKKIVEKNLQSVLVAMDRDYDDFRCRIINDRRVIYTYGYSLENDLFNMDVVEDVIVTMSRSAEARELVSPKLNDILATVDTGFRRLVPMDCAYVAAGKKFLDRDRPGCAVDVCPKSNREPKVNRTSINKLVRSSDRKDSSFIFPLKIVEIISSKHLVGKIWFFLIFHASKYILNSEFGRSVVSIDHFCDLAMEVWKRMEADHGNNEISSYYREKLSGLAAA